MASEGSDKKKDDKETKKKEGVDDATAGKDETKTDDDKKPATPALPPLDASAYRLERLLGGGRSSSATTATTTATAAKKREEHHLLVTNPAKIVRRWLGSSSGAAGDATLITIGETAKRVLDPSDGSPVAGGRRLLIEIAESYGGDGDGDAMQVESSESVEEKKSEEEDAVEPPPYLAVAHREVEAWLLSLAVRVLWKDGKYRESLNLATRSCSIVRDFLDGVSATNVGDDASSPGALTVMNSPALFPLLSRLYRLRSLAAEYALGKREAADALRGDLVEAHRMACLRRDADGQSTLLNLLLRDLLACDRVEQAQKLLANSTFPGMGGGGGEGGGSAGTGGATGGSVSNNQLCRYLYHSGRVQALRLEYTQAYSNLSQCLRKAPTNAGLGFRIAAQRLLVVVQLLMGEIPERNLFFQAGMRVELGPYLEITQAVRRGDLAVFHTTVSTHADRLRQDGTYTLISRLSHSVVKAGLRRLNVSYSRISLEDVAERLGLPSASSAEFVVAKAVRDGVVDATVNHTGKYLQSHDLMDVYATTEPAEAFHRRIAYCLATHNDATRGMRYPPDAYKKQLEASRGKKGGSNEDEKTDEEKAQEMEDEMEDEF